MSKPSPVHYKKAYVFLSPEENMDRDLAAPTQKNGTVEDWLRKSVDVFFPRGRSPTSDKCDQ